LAPLGSYKCPQRILTMILTAIRGTVTNMSHEDGRPLEKAAAIPRIFAFLDSIPDGNE
jgi:hypothetical protein